MSDTDRVLAALTMAGARGVTRVEFLAPNVCDGGKPIVNFPARIYDLRQAGIEIVKVGRRNACDVFVLGRSVETTASEPKGIAHNEQAGSEPVPSHEGGRPVSSSPVSDSLFELPQRPTNAIYGDAA